MKKEIEKALSEFKKRGDCDNYKVIMIGARIDPVNIDENLDTNLVDGFEKLSMEVFVGASTSLDGDGDVLTMYQKVETFDKTDNNKVDSFVDLASYYAKAYEENFYVEVSELGSIRFFTPMTPYMSEFDYFKVAVEESKKDGWIYGGIVFRVPIIL